jgi:hypothetical protein
VAEVEQQRRFVASFATPIADPRAVAAPPLQEREPPMPIRLLKRISEMIGCSLKDVGTFYDRQQIALQGLVPARAMAYAASDEEGEETESQSFDVWDGGTLAEGLSLRLTRFGSEYRARVEVDPSLRQRYAGAVVHLDILGQDEERLLAPREIPSGGALLLGNLPLARGMVVIATLLTGEGERRDDAGEPSRLA